MSSDSAERKTGIWGNLDKRNSEDTWKTGSEAEDPQRIRRAERIKEWDA